jgi:hypothetical protein
VVVVLASTLVTPLWTMALVITLPLLCLPLPNIVVVLALVVMYLALLPIPLSTIALLIIHLGRLFLLIPPATMKALGRITPVMLLLSAIGALKQIALL